MVHPGTDGGDVVYVILSKPRAYVFKALSICLLSQYRSDYPSTTSRLRYRNP